MCDGSFRPLSVASLTPEMKSIRLSVRSAVLALLALALPAPSALATSVPLEVRPSQGPPGSSAILHASGFTADEDVRIYVDGRQVTTDPATDGEAAKVVKMPAAQGAHRIVLKGMTSGKTAAGTFTTTFSSDAARPAFLVSPRPAAGGGPYTVDYHVANFPAHSMVEVL